MKTFFFTILVFFLSARGANDSTPNLGSSKSAAGNVVSFGALTHAAFLTSTYVSQDGNGNKISNTGEGGILLTPTAFPCADLQAVASRGTGTFIQNTNFIYVQTAASSYLSAGTQTIYADKDPSRPDSPVSASAFSQLCQNGNLLYREGVTTGTVSGTLNIRSVLKTPASVTGSINAIFSGMQAAAITFNAPVCEIPTYQRFKRGRIELFSVNCLARVDVSPLCVKKHHVVSRLKWP